MTKPRLFTEDLKTEAKGKIGEYRFKGQHAFKGGFSSCTANALEAIAVFSHLPDTQFFELWPPPSDLTEEQKKISCERLDAICEAGNRLSIEGSETKDVLGKGDKQGAKASFFGFCKIILGKETIDFLNKIKSNMQKHENIKNIAVLKEAVECDKTSVLDFTKKTYEEYISVGFSQKDIYFISCAAYHTIAFFAKMHPSNHKTYYYLFDTSPARAIGGDTRVGLLEVFDSLESVVQAMLTRWSSTFISDNRGILHVMTTQTRIKELQQTASSQDHALTEPGDDDPVRIHIKKPKKTS